MDNSFPNEPVHGAAAPRSQALSSDQATSVNVKEQAKLPEPTAKPTLTQAAKGDAAEMPGQLNRPTDLNQASGLQTSVPAQMQSRTFLPPVTRPVPPTVIRTEPDINMSQDAMKPNHPNNDMAAVNDRRSNKVIPQSAEQMDEPKPVFEEHAAEQPVRTLPDVQPKPVGLSTVDPAITMAGGVGKSVEVPDQPVDSSLSVLRLSVSPNPKQILDEYPEDTKEELERISASIIAATPKSEQARQVFANRTRIRSLLKRGRTVKQIYNHLVDVERISAENVSSIQFERQVDYQKLRDKSDKSPP